MPWERDCPSTKDRDLGASPRDIQRIGELWGSRGGQPGVLRWLIYEGRLRRWMACPLAKQ